MGTSSKLKPQQIQQLRRLPVRDRLRQARTLAQRTQTEMAVALGVSQNGVSALEHGRYGNTTVTSALRLAEYFGVTVEDLFKERA